MRKIFILIIIIIIFISVNILFNNKNIYDEKSTQPLAELLNLKIQDITSFIISNDDKIVLSRPYGEACIRIESINYCADSTKINILKKFLNNNIKDTYDKTEENLQRLGFKKEIIPSIIINNEKTLFFGNLNKYNEIYVLQGNKIYKTLFYEGILETTTRSWLDKSTPLIPLTDTDEFDIKIIKYIYTNSKLIDERTCASIKHEEIVLTTKHSALKNSFIDLYPSDATRGGYPYSKDDESYTILLSSANRDNSSTISIYQEEHLTYGIIDQSDLRFVIPNSVYNNVKSYCKK